jgi:hypothetical protein
MTRSDEGECSMRKWTATGPAGRYEIITRPSDAERARAKLRAITRWFATRARRRS